MVNCLCRVEVRARLWGFRSDNGDVPGMRFASSGLRLLMDAGVSGMLCWKAIRARLVAMQSPTRRLRVRHKPQHNIDLSHVPTTHSLARQAKRVFLVTAIRPHGVCSQTLMLAGLNGELILFEFMLGFILHPNLRAIRRNNFNMPA